MSGWLELEQDKLDEGTQREIRGVEVMVFLSPYDIPEAVRGSFDKSIDRFVIEFKYLGGPEEPNEPLDKESQDKHVVLAVGRHSHRLYRIEVDVVSLGVEAVGLHVLEDEMDGAIDWLSDQRERPGNRGHYEIVKKAISEHSTELFRDLVPQ